MAGNKNEIQISYYDLPQVFSRLWNDAENKNERLREIQVKRINNKSGEDFKKLVAHPTDISSSHINLDDLQEAGSKKR